MRIAMLHWAFPPVIGGVESHLATLCPALVARGADVWLLTGSVDGRHQRTVWSGVRLARTPFMDLNRLRPMSDDVTGQSIRREIGQFLAEARPHVVHAHNLHYFSPTHLDAVASWCHKAGVPLVLTAHNVWSDDLWRRMCQRAQVWDRVIAVSAHIARELELAGFPPERLAVVHHGLDTERFRPAEAAGRRAVRRRYPFAAGRRVILHPARTSLAKGSLQAVEALARVRRVVPSALLVCAGAGPIVDWDRVQEAEIAQVRDAIRRHGIEEHVVIRSFPWEEMACVYHLAQVVVYPSLFEEPFGLAPLEAMASGVPVVVSRSGGMPEFVDDGRTGFVVPRGDAEALAGRCLELLLRPSRARAMGRRARRAVVERHAVARMADLTWQVYESVLAGGRVA
jgi:glycosyltransferase involved in cell wall biosynthesis